MLASLHLRQQGKQFSFYVFSMCVSFTKAVGLNCMFMQNMQFFIYILYSFIIQGVRGLNLTRQFCQGCFS